MPENKQEIKKLVKEELKKKGVEATDEVVEQLAEVAGSDLDGVSGGINAAGRIALAVGGAAAMAGAGALAMWGGKKAYDKHKGNVTVPKNERERIDEALLAAGKTIERFENADGVQAFDGNGRPVDIANVRSFKLANIEQSK